MGELSRITCGKCGTVHHLSTSAAAEYAAKGIKKLAKCGFCKTVLSSTKEKIKEETKGSKGYFNSEKPDFEVKK